ncbi:hypothetical protein KR054_000327, partial [Drosophila jambulina]
FSLKFLPLVALLAIVRGDPEAPIVRISPVAPYAPAGWHPQIPFNLPNEFLPARSSNPSVQITKARVEQVYPFQQLDIPEAGNVKPISRPANQYGAPDPGFKIVYPDEEEPATSKDSAEPNQSSIREGRYFIISQDNTLQRVTFSSEQNGNDEDFTARLTYSTVGQLKDPVYRYNSQGQLERVLK